MAVIAAVLIASNVAAYKYTNDQALLLANKGYSLNDIGHMQIPDEISKKWYIRPHYGHYSTNARGAYMRYLGFYDGNPVNLLPLEKQEEARKLVEYIGSEELILEKAVKDFENGEYQWVATITNYYAGAGMKSYTQAFGSCSFYIAIYHKFIVIR